MTDERSGKCNISDLSPAHVEYFDYWKRAKGTNQLALRSRFDPLDIPRLLSALTVAEVHEGESQGEYRFRYRLIGTVVARTLGRDGTGRWFSELYQGKGLQEFITDFSEIAETAAPSLKSIEYKVPGREFIRYRRLSLPWSQDGTSISQIISHLDFEEQAEVG